MHKLSVVSKCAFCGRDFLTWHPNSSTSKPHKYCSKKCYLEFTKANPSHNPAWLGGPIRKICLICGKEYFVPRHRDRDTKHCSRACHNLAIGKSRIGKPLPENIKEKISGPNSPHWRGGTSKSPWPFEFGVELKRKIRDRDGNKCRICNREYGYRDGRKLAVHHINWDKSDCRPKNLISICASCHSKMKHVLLLWGEQFPNQLNKEVCL